MPSEQAASGPGAEPASPPAGYSQTPLPRKLGIGDGDTVAVIGAPGWLEDLLAGQDEIADLHTDLDARTRYDVIVAFVTQRAELEAELPRLRAAMAPACGLWIAWPKRAARLPTDLTDHVVREIARPAWWTTRCARSTGPGRACAW